MAGTLASLRIMLGLDSTGVIAGVAKTKVAMTGLQTAVGIGSLAIVAAAAMSVKAAADWESAFAGVKKTLDTTGLSAEQEAAAFDKLEAELREMARTIPVAHEELAEIAEAAGALGIARHDIAKFTEVVAKMAATTNVSAEQGATALGKIGAVMPWLEGEFESFADVLVNLGNTGASTESEILDMAQSFSGAASLVGLSKTQMLGWAAAMANVGEEAEAGGSSLSRLFTNVDRFVATSAPQLQGIAEMLGVTVDQFRAMYENDPSATLQSIVEGLSGMGDGARYAAYELLGVNDIRITRALDKLVSGVDGLGGALTNAGDSAGAMGIEFEKRLETAQAQFQILQNTLYDLAITIGDALLPHVVNLAKGLKAIVDAVGSLARQFPVLVDVITPVVTILASILALRFGAKLLTSLIPIPGAFGNISKAALTTSTTMGPAGAAAGKAFGAGLIGGVLTVVTVAALAEALEEPANAIADDLNATIFGDPAALEAQGGKFAGTVIDSIADGIHAGTDALAAIDIWPFNNEEQAAAAVETGHVLSDGFVEGMRDRFPFLRQTTHDTIVGPVRAAAGDAIDIVAEIPDSIYDALENGKSTVRQAMQNLKKAMLDPTADLDEIAYIRARLAGDKLAEGLASKNPIIRGEAERTRAILMAELTRLQGLRAGGAAVADAWGQGFRDALIRNRNSAIPILSSIRDMLGGSLPTAGPLVGSWEGGKSVATAWATGLLGAIATVPAMLGGAMGGIAGALSPNFGGLTPALAGSGMAGGGIQVDNITIHISGASGDPKDVGNAAKQGVLDALGELLTGGPASRQSYRPEGLR